MDLVTITDPAAKAPVDPNVKLPKSITDASAKSDAIHKAVYNTPDPEQPAEPPAEPPQVSQAPQEAAPAPQPEQPPPPPQPELPPPSTPQDRAGADPRSWEGRFYAMEGRYRQSQQQVGSMQQQLTEMGDELMRVTNILQQAPEDRPLNNRPDGLITRKDIDTYGPELIGLMQRAAREAVAPDLTHTYQQVQQVSKVMGETAHQSMIAACRAAIPNWDQINLSPRFKSWCSLPDIYSGMLRADLLNVAVQAADAPRVIAFFQGFLNEEHATGHMSSPQQQAQQPPQTAPRQAAASLETFAAPGKAKPAGGNSPVAADKPIFTRSEIKRFYEDVRRGVYRGREEEQLRREHAIIAASRDQRVQEI